MTKDEIFEKLKTEVTIRGLSPGTYYTYGPALEEYIQRFFLPLVQLIFPDSLSLFRLVLTLHLIASPANQSAGILPKFDKYGDKTGKSSTFLSKIFHGRTDIIQLPAEKETDRMPAILSRGASRSVDGTRAQHHGRGKGTYGSGCRRRDPPAGSTGGNPGRRPG